MKKMINKITVWILTFGMVFSPILTGLDLVVVNAEEMTATEQAQSEIETAEQIASDAEENTVVVNSLDDAVKTDTDEIGEFQDEAAQLIVHDEAALDDTKEAASDISELKDNLDTAVSEEQKIITQAKEIDVQAKNTSDAIKALEEINNSVEAGLTDANSDTDAAKTIEELEQIQSNADAMMEEAKGKFEESQEKYDDAKQKYEDALTELDAAEKAYDEAVNDAKTNKKNAEDNLDNAIAELEEAKKVADLLAQKEAEAKEAAEKAELEFVAAEKEAKDAQEQAAKAAKDAADKALSEAQEIIGAADLSGTYTEIVVAIAKYYYTYIFEKEEGVTVTVRAQNELTDPKNKDFNKNNIKVEFSDGTSLELAGIVAFEDGKPSFGISSHKGDNYDKEGSGSWICSNADLEDAVSKININELKILKDEADEAYDSAAKEKEDADNEVSEVIKAAKEELAKKQENYNKLSDDVKAAKEALDAASDKVDELKDQIQNLKLDNLLSTNVAEIAANKVKLAELKKAMEDAKEDKKNAEDKYDELVSDKKELDEKIQEKKEAIEEASKNTPKKPTNDPDSDPEDSSDESTTDSTSEVPATTPSEGVRFAETAPTSGVAGVRVRRTANNSIKPVAVDGKDGKADGETYDGIGKTIIEEELPGAKEPVTKARKTVKIEEEELPAAKEAPEKSYFPWWLLLILLAIILGYSEYKYNEKKKEERENNAQ